MRFSMFSSRRMFWVFAVVAALVCAALLVSGKQPVYAQVTGNRVPNLIGPWTFYTPTACHFSDTLDPTVPPVPICGTPPGTGTPIEITHQSGRVFAGNHPGASDKFTGYLAAGRNRKRPLLLALCSRMGTYLRDGHSTH